jgi:hypothetical protein
MKTALRVVAIACLLAFASIAIQFGIPLLPVNAQNAGPYTYRDTGNGVAFYQPVCFEASALAGQDVCMKRSTAGHVAFLTGTLAANKDVHGTCTAAAATTCVITFTTAYTAAPVCMVTDQTTAANGALKALPTTTTLTITTASSSDVFSYVCFGT